MERRVVDLLATSAFRRPAVLTRIDDGGEAMEAGMSPTDTCINAQALAERARMRQKGPLASDCRRYVVESYFGTGSLKHAFLLTLLTENRASGTDRPCGRRGMRSVSRCQSLLADHLRWKMDGWRCEENLAQGVVMRDAGAADQNWRLSPSR